jgi:hypothetical protein
LTGEDIKEDVLIVAEETLKQLFREELKKAV